MESNVFITLTFLSFRFQAKGMDVGVPDESLNGVHYDESESSSDENDDG